MTSDTKSNATEDPSTQDPVVLTFVSWLYLLGATLALVFAGLLSYGLLLIAASVVTVVGLILVIAMLAGVSFAVGRGWVRVHVEPKAEQLVVRRWLRPSLRVPLRPGAVRVRGATYGDRSVGPVLVADESTSKAIHSVVDGLLDDGGRMDLDDEFVVFELHSEHAEPRVVLVPFGRMRAPAQLDELARCLGPALVDVRPRRAAP